MKMSLFIFKIGFSNKNEQLHLFIYFDNQKKMIRPGKDKQQNFMRKKNQGLINKLKVKK
jgi:hypothetical protein